MMNPGAMSQRKLVQKMENKVDRFEHDKTLMYQNNCNRRMFLCVLVVCLTFILIIIAYTIREKNWIDAMVAMKTPAITEVDNGTQQSGNP